MERIEIVEVWPSRGVRARYNGVEAWMTWGELQFAAKQDDKELAAVYADVLARGTAQANAIREMWARTDPMARHKHTVRQGEDNEHWYVVAPSGKRVITATSKELAHKLAAELTRDSSNGETGTQPKHAPDSDYLH